MPLKNVKTGIGRYLSSLYDALSALYVDEFDIYYFDGARINREPPKGPNNVAQWSLLTKIFWSLPPFIALWIRFILHTRKELVFKRLSKGFDIYHEVGFFPFKTHDHVRTVFTVHDMSVFRVPEWHPAERVTFMNRLLPKRVELAHSIITVSEFSKQEIIDVLDIDAGKITVCPLGVTVDAFHEQSPTKIQAGLERLNIPPKFFLFVGGGDPRKNLDTVLSAFKKADLDTPLVVVGWKGWYDTQMPGHVKPLGYISDDDLAILYSAALALLFPSNYEGFGLPIIEAFACGCPVVTTRNASLPEVAGELALYMRNPKDVEGLADILLQLREGENQSDTARTERKRWASKYTWEKAAHITAQVFHSALSKSNERQ